MLALHRPVCAVILGFFTFVAAALSSTLFSIPSSLSLSNSSQYDCNAYLPSIYVWNWQPHAITTAEDGQSVTPTVSTDASGIQVATVIVTTSARLHDGTWEALTSLSTVTFPTGRYDMPAYYQWCSSSACADDNTATVMMPHSVQFPSASLYYDGVQTFTGKGLYWSLHSTYLVAGPPEVSWFRSAYSDQVPLQSCKPTSVMSSNGRPPIVLQPWAAFDPAVTTAAVASTKAVPAPVHTFGRIHDSATQGALKPTSTKTSGQGRQKSATPIAHDPHEPDDATNGEEQPTSRTDPDKSSLHALVGSRTVPIPEPIAKSSEVEFGSSEASSIREETITRQAHATGRRPSDVINSDLPSVLTITDSKPTTRNGEGGVINLTGRESATQVKSGAYILGNGQTVSAEGPAATVANMTISISRGGTVVVVNGHTSKLPTVQSNPVQVVGGVTVFVSHGNVLFHGHTLALTSTLTVGNGSILTRLALATDSAGHTVLLGDTTKLAVPSLASSMGSMSGPSMPWPTSSRVLESSIPAQSSQASQSSTSGAQTSQPLALMLCTIVAVLMGGGRPAWLR